MLESNEPMTICCGRPISPQEVSEIQETVKLFGNLSRKELSQTICEHLDWRTASGSNKWTACLKMLKKFEKQGLLTLPRKKHQTRPRKHPIRFTPRTAPGPAINAKLKDLSRVYLKILEKQDEIRLWNEYVHRYHYLAFHRPFGYTLRYFIGCDQAILGCLLFSGAAKAITPRDEWIGWTPDRRIKNLSWVINNSRFLILPWVRVPNLASHVLGKISRRIGDDWQDKWGFRPALMETFVDPSRYSGTCYLAANWAYLGMTTGKGLARKGKTYQTSPKLIFVKPLCNDFRERLCSDNPESSGRFRHTRTSTTGAGDLPLTHNRQAKGGKK